MLMLSRGLVVSMEQLLSGVGFDIRVSATQATPLTGPPITNMADTVAALAALPEIEDVVPLRIGEAQVDIGRRSGQVSFMGADVTNRRPWTLVEGRDIDRSRQALGADRRWTIDCRSSSTETWRGASSSGPAPRVTLRGACTANSSVPPVVFHVNGIVEFPFDQARQLTAITSAQRLRANVRRRGAGRSRHADDRVPTGRWSGSCC